MRELASVTKKERQLSGTILKLGPQMDRMLAHDAHTMIIEEWIEIDQKFVETNICGEIRDALLSKCILTVSGISGIGKSVHIRHIALEMRKSGYEIIPCFSPRDISDYFKQNRKQVFVIDDVCGRYTVIQSDIESWIKYEVIILKLLEESGSKLMASCRLQIFKEKRFKRLTFFTDCAIELSKTSVNSKQKLAIAEKYLPLDVVKSIEHIVDKCDVFPFKCALYKKESHIHADAAKFFQNIFDLYIEEFSKLLEQDDKTKYFALALLVLCNGVLKFPYIANAEAENNTRLHNLFEEFEISVTQKNRIIEQLDSFIGTYIIRESIINEFGIEIMVTYKPVHDKLFDVLSYHCGTNKQTTFITHANSSVISQRTQLKSINADLIDDYTIIIDECNEVLYFSRIMNDLREGKTEDVFQSRQIVHAEYRSKLIAKISDDRDILNKLFKEPVNRQKTLYCICASGQHDFIAFASQTVNSLHNLIINAYSSDKAIMKYFRTLIIKFGGSINCCSVSLYVFEGPLRRYTPLVCVCFHGHLGIAQLLIDEGARVNFNTSYHGITPLIAAISKKQADVVRLLIDNGADVSLADYTFNLGM